MRSESTGPATADTARDAYIKSAGAATLWNNEIWHQHAALDLPAGSFAVTAKVHGIRNDHEPMYSECRVRLGSTVLDQIYDKGEQYERQNATLLGIGSLSAAGKAIVECRRDVMNGSEHDGVVDSSRIMAVKVANDVGGTLGHRFPNGR